MPLPCSVLVVQHLAPSYKSMLPQLLRRSCQIQVKHAEHGEGLLPGVVYIAPPDEHLLVGPGKVQLAHSQLVHFSRPSIDLLFESAAGTYGSRCVGVLLSGSGSDGSAGIRTIKEAGGVTMVQDPESAEYPSMPRAAVDSKCVDYICPLPELGRDLRKLCCGSPCAES